MTKREAVKAARWVGAEFRGHNIYIAHDTKLGAYEAFGQAAKVLGKERARAAAIAGWTEKDQEIKAAKGGK